MMLIIFYFLALVASGTSFVLLYGFEYNWMNLLFAVPLIYAIYLLSRNKKINSVFMASSLFICIPISIILFFSVQGRLYDASGHICTGFFSIVQPCIENAELAIYILVLNPIVIMALLLVIAVGIWWQVSSLSTKGK